MPCLTPHLNMAFTFPCRVRITTGMLCACSAAHSTYPCGGHPLLRRAVHMSSVVMRSNNVSSSSDRCPRMVEGCWSACSRVAAWMSVRSSAARPFRYACIMGWSVLVVSKICEVLCNVS